MRKERRGISRCLIEVDEELSMMKYMGNEGTC